MTHWDDDPQCVICGFVKVDKVFNDKRNRRSEGGWVNIYQKQRYKRMPILTDTIIFDWNKTSQIQVRFEYEPRKIYERSTDKEKSRIIKKAALSGLWLPIGHKVYPNTVLERRLRKAIEGHIGMTLIAKLYAAAILHVIVDIDLRAYKNKDYMLGES